MKTFHAIILIGCLTSLIFLVSLQQSTATTTCTSFDPIKNLVTVSCSEHFSQIAADLNDPSKISNMGQGVWLIKTTISSANNTTFSIDSSDKVSWLKITGGNGIIINGRAEIDGIKITSWDAATNAPISQDSAGSIPRGYIWFLGSEGGWITNSDISDLGYQAVGKTGIAFHNMSHDVLLYHNKIHSLWFGTYSSGAYNITIDGNEYYNNLFYAIDPHSGSHDFTIINNNVHNNLQFGIIFSLQCYNFLVENNTVSNDGGGKTGNGYGIFFSRESFNSIARYNTVFNESTGIIVSQSSDNQVYGNKIHDTKTAIALRNAKEGNATNNFIHDNEITNNDIGILSNETNSNRISNTTFTGTEPSYYLKDGATIQIEKQKFVNSQIFGFNGTNTLKIVNSGSIQVEGLKTVYNTDKAPATFHLTNNNLILNTVMPTDTTAPTLSIIAPANNTSTITTSVLVSGTATDDTSVQSVSWKVDGGPVNTATGTTSWSFNTPSLSVGSHIIWVNATDPAGNISSKHIGINIVIVKGDTTAPTLSIIAPANNTSTITTSVLVSGTATDDTSVQSVSWKVDGGPVNTATGTTSWSFNTPSLSVGSHIIWVNATDPAGNISSKHIGINIVIVKGDTTAPTLSIIAPANNTSTITTSVLVSGTATDDTSVQSVSWKVDGGPVNTATGTTSWSFNTPSLSVGSHIIWVNATDPAGNISSKHIGITVSTIVHTTGTVSGRVYDDLNGNGMQDTGESATSGVNIVLYSYTAGQIVGMTITDSVGQYIFNNVSSGGIAIFETTPDGTTNTQPGGSIPGTYYGSVLAGQTGVFDFGNSKVSAPTTITGTIYDDHNGDGILDNGEQGTAGVQITLYSYTTGQNIGTTSDANGKYGFDNIPSGGIAVLETIPAGTTNTQPGGSIPGAYYGSVLAGQTGVFDFGNHASSTAGGTVSGIVYGDIDGNGVQNPSESGISGVTVILYSYVTGQNVGFASTDSNGHYTFVNVPAGGIAVLETITAGTINTQPGGSIPGAYYGSVLGGQTGVFDFGNH